jgi:thiol-disulfide isomerase/thioredoxin
MGRLSRCVTIIAVAILPGGCAPAAKSNGTAAKPSAAELVEGVIAQESKIDAVQSIYLRFEGKWTRSSELIAENLAQRKKAHPGEEIDVAKHGELWPEMTEELELAFDQKRVRKSEHWHKASLDVRVFDGERAVNHQRAFTFPYEEYAIGSSPQRFFEHPFGDLSWLRLGTHQFWFAKNASAAKQMQANGLPRDYTFGGQADFRGRRCYVLDNPQVSRRLHVGVDDGRLYGMAEMGYPAGVDVLPVYSKAAGRAFASDAEFEPWSRALAGEERAKFWERYSVEVFPLLRPSTEWYMDDYRELAPGFWFPATQGYISTTLAAEPYVESQREFHLVEAKANEPLADSLFSIELKDGVEVTDCDYDPPLSYTQKADRTPEEWQKIVGAHEKQSDRWKKENAVRDAWVGKAAPELPKSAWVNSGPVTLTSLKGKVVVLDFWSTGCGPCRRDLAFAEESYKRALESGIVVIGVHSSGSDVDEIQNVAKEMNLSFPIVIDLPPPDEEISFGALFHELGVISIPYSFVIDQEGNVVSHGPHLGALSVLDTAYKLARESKP